MAQRVNLSPIGLPIRKKTFLAKTAEVIIAVKAILATFSIKEPSITFVIKKPSTTFSIN